MELNCYALARSFWNYWYILYYRFFFDKQHQFDIQKLEGLWKKLVDLEDLAKSRGINDIFQDNGAKVLQQLIISNMKFLPGREGNDAEDRNGVEWEFKSVNIDTSARGFSTDHHTTVNLLVSICLILCNISLIYPSISSISAVVGTFPVPIAHTGS